MKTITKPVSFVGIQSSYNSQRGNIFSQSRSLFAQKVKTKKSKRHWNFKKMPYKIFASRYGNHGLRITVQGQLQTRISITANLDKRILHKWGNDMILFNAVWIYFILRRLPLLSSYNRTCHYSPLISVPNLAEPQSLAEPFTLSQKLFLN